MKRSTKIIGKKSNTRSQLGLIGSLAVLAFASPAVFADHDRYDRYEDCDVEQHVHHHYYQGNGHNARHYRPKRRSNYQVHNHYYGQQPNYGHSGYYRQPAYHAGYGSSGGYLHRPNFGNAVGGALGGFVGSQIGSGSGNQAATAAGAILGYALGGRF